MKVLELGSCTGLHSRKVSKIVAPGKVISFDIEHKFLLYQKQHSKKHRKNLFLVEGDCLALPFRADFFDYAYCRFLFQYLKQPERALSEVRRVLRPGGKFLVVDTDDYYDTYFPPLPSVVRAYQALAKLQERNGGDRFVGRKLFHYMASAHFRDIIVRVVPTMKFGLRNKQILLRDIIPMFKEEYFNILDAGLMTKEEFDEAISSLETSAWERDTFYLGLIFIVCGEK